MLFQMFLAMKNSSKIAQDDAIKLYGDTIRFFESLILYETRKKNNTILVALEKTGNFKHTTFKVNHIKPTRQKNIKLHAFTCITMRC